MRSAVLVAEPELETREYLGRQLRDDGFDVLGAARRSEALELAETARPDVVLIAELELCLSLRRGEPGRSWDRNVPVIVLASSSDPVERVRALDRGADDVIGRPFAYEELLARIRALLRRRLPASADAIVAGDLELDRPTRRVNVRGTAVFLSAKEFELVAKLASEPYRVFTKEELLREVWGYRALGRTRTLESHASRVRKKLCVGPRTASSSTSGAWATGCSSETRLARALELEQRLLDVETSRIAGEVAGGAHDAMARKHDRNPVAVHHRPDGTRGARVADAARKLAVRRRLAVRDARELVENRDREGRKSTEIEREVEALPASVRSTRRARGGRRRRSAASGARAALRFVRAARACSPGSASNEIVASPRSDAATKSVADRRVDDVEADVDQAERRRGVAEAAVEIGGDGHDEILLRMRRTPVDAA